MPTEKEEQAATSSPDESSQRRRGHPFLPPERYTNQVFEDRVQYILRHALDIAGSKAGLTGREFPMTDISWVDSQDSLVVYTENKAVSATCEEALAAKEKAKPLAAIYPHLFDETSEGGMSTLCKGMEERQFTSILRKVQSGGGCEEYCGVGLLQGWSMRIEPKQPDSSSPYVYPMGHTITIPRTALTAGTRKSAADSSAGDSPESQTD